METRDKAVMQHLKLTEHTPMTLFVFLAIGTIISLVLIFFIFTSNWKVAIAVALLVDVSVFFVYKYSSNTDHKIIEINHEGIVTNKETIKYNDIHHVGQNTEQTTNGKVNLVKNYLVVKTHQKKYAFYTDIYHNSQTEILACIEGNLKSYKTIK
jgi:hypothetical protein